MKPEQQKNLLFILIPSTILIIAWIGFGIYNKSVTTTISQAQKVAIQPIPGTFDRDAFNLLRTRKVLSPVTDVDEVEPTVDETSESSLSADPLPELPPSTTEPLPTIEEGEITE